MLIVTCGNVNTVAILHCSSSCNDNNSNHIGIYRGYNTDRLFRRVCGNRRSYQFTYGGQYIYITFHTTSQANTQRNTGFSTIEFFARGTVYVHWYM